ncbi:MAG: FAD-binding oxidoreductase [Actinobacteria bacterium]|nr:FAD-binding oxidoreductase [Actinomycetota bacterium]
MKKPDAIILGAGIVGAACALQLTNAGLRVLVIDRGAIASGTTGSGEGNILVSDKEPGAELTLAMRSRDAWFELSDDIGGGFELEAKGGLVVARTSEDIQELRALASRQKIAGVEAEEADGEGLRQLEPYLSEEISFGVHYSGDAQCQPMLATAQILRVVRERGGSVLPETNVTGISMKDGAVTGVVTSSGAYSSEIVVNAGGTWAGEIAALAGSFMPIAPRKGFILVTAPLPQLIRHKVYDADYVANVASDDVSIQSSAVVEGTRSGTILIGASRERVGFASNFDVSVLRLLAAQAIALFPVLKNVPLMRAYYGFRPYAPDHLPVIGEDPVVRGLWHAAGHEGAGIGLAPATAELVRAQITGSKSFMDAELFSPARFYFDGQPRMDLIS